MKFDTYGIENCSIVLLAEIEVENIEQQRRSEIEHIELYRGLCVNLNRPCVTAEEAKAKDQEYIDTHRERSNARQREYNKAHREEQKAKSKAYYQQNKEKIQAYFKARREAKKSNAGLFSL